MASKDSGEPDSNALTWKAWFVRAMAKARMEPADLVRLTEGTAVELKYSTISKWTSGRGGADPDRVIVVAQLLREDVVEALRAAGHRLIADQVEGRSGTPVSIPGAQARSAVDDALAALRASDLPEHLKRKFEDEYAQMLGPMAQAIEAARRKFAAEIEDALDARERRGEQAGERGAESA